MMQKTDTYYKQLLDKYLADECTFQETEELFSYLNRSASGRVLLNSIKSDFETALQQPRQMDTERSAQMWKAVEQRIKASPSTPRLYQLRSWQTVAAVFALLVLSVTLYISLNKTGHQADPSSQPALAIHKNDIPPGKNKAILTLADGSTIILDDVKAGLLSKQGNISISKTTDGQLIYNQQTAQSSQQAPSTTAMNTISTPKGGQYQVILPDGSKVWLNANSSLKFPTAFANLERAVKLEGEAYFEIEKDQKRPFKVLANHQTIKVMGTHFNVMAYEEEDHISTTLLEGSVLVGHSNGEKLLKPGQQSILHTASGDFDIRMVDPEESIAWKDGYFLFQSENIYSIMRKISRWYNVEVVYESNMENKAFGGMISRFKNISEVLKMLELTGDVHFKIEERRILVMP